MSPSGSCRCHLSEDVILSQHVFNSPQSRSSGRTGPSLTPLVPRVLTVSVYVCVCCQLVFEAAFNSARGGYVAIDDISFSSEFCHTDTGEKTRQRSRTLVRHRILQRTKCASFRRPEVPTILWGKWSRLGKTRLHSSSDGGDTDLPRTSPPGKGRRSQERPKHCYEFSLA